MKRYHFKIDDQSDARGVELADLAAAKCEAAKVAASYACGLADDRWDDCRWTVTVTDDDGQVVLRLELTGIEVAERS
jgi:1,4-alpha-glucan branching enzyme